MRALLAGAELATVKAGDLWDDPPHTVRVGSVTLESPGFPTTYVFGVEDGAVAFRALALGPFHHRYPDENVEKLLAGESYVIEEAQGAAVRVCVGGFCTVLSQKNGFRSRFRAVLPQSP